MYYKLKRAVVFFKVNTSMHAFTEKKDIYQPTQWSRHVEVAIHQPWSSGVNTFVWSTFNYLLNVVISKFHKETWPRNCWNFDCGCSFAYNMLPMSSCISWVPFSETQIGPLKHFLLAICTLWKPRLWSKYSHRCNHQDHKCRTMHSCHSNHVEWEGLQFEMR